MESESQAELEKPMKVYQGKAILAEVREIKQLVEGQATMLQGTVSQPYLEQRLKGLEEKIENKYGPYLAGVKWTAKTATTAFVSVILMVIGIYLKSS